MGKVFFWKRFIPSLVQSLSICWSVCRLIRKCQSMARYLTNWKGPARFWWKCLEHLRYVILQPWSLNNLKTVELVSLWEMLQVGLVGFLSMLSSNILHGILLALPLSFPHLLDLSFSYLWTVFSVLLHLFILLLFPYTTLKFSPTFISLSCGAVLLLLLSLHEILIRNNDSGVVTLYCTVSLCYWGTQCRRKSG